MTEHLSDKQLLRHLDDELSRLEVSRVTNHLRSCWSCQVEYERLKGEISAIFDGQANAFDPALPPPPDAWPRLEPLLAKASARANAPAWRK